MPKITPHGNRVLVEIRPVPNIAGIVLPEGAQDAFTLHVIEVGDGLRFDNGIVVPVPFKAGDEVICSNGGATVLAAQLYGGKRIAIVAVESIVCKVERSHPTDGMGWANAKPIVKASKAPTGA